MPTARIHSFESFGTLDGPGIRFVVFFQGCGLRCHYCHNRDLWPRQGGEKKTVSEVLNMVKSYVPYYGTRGGVTATGGEPLLQAEFLAAFFPACQKEGIHTCLDTAGAIPVDDTIERVIRATDLVLLDIKHMNPGTCRQLTGEDNETTLSFARWLDTQDVPVWIRYVLIPGYTDAVEDLTALRSFIRSLSNVEKVEVLPYHTLGEHKWDILGHPYPLAGVRAPSKEQIAEVSAFFNGR